MEQESPVGSASRSRIADVAPDLVSRGVVRKRLGLVIAFAFGALLTYGVISINEEEWALVVTAVGTTARLEDIVASKEMCLKIKNAFETYDQELRKMYAEKQLDPPIATWENYTCLLLSKVRGLPLKTGSGG